MEQNDSSNSSDKKIQWFERVINRPQNPRSLIHRFLAHFRRKMIAGLVTITPIAITAYLSLWIFGLVAKAQWVQKISQLLGVANDYLSTGLTLVLLLVVIYLVGVVSTTVLVKTFIRVAEFFVTSIPLVKSIYGVVKQVVDAFRKPEGKSSISRKVVLVEYPRPNCYGLAFVTAESIINGVLHCHVLVLTTPNPTSGWVLLLPATDVWEIGMTTDEGMKFILSGGIVTPDNIQMTPYVPTNRHLQDRLREMKFGKLPNENGEEE